ncbi:adenosine monophosphate deaminase [Aphelenchoides avenae]|nr:adenosine monophosphate deaminase [Aphelenchus avenae]
MDRHDSGRDSDSDRTSPELATLISVLSPSKCAEYQRMMMTGEELRGDPLKNLIEAGKFLTSALRMRAFYMDKLGGRFSPTVRKYMSDERRPTQCDADFDQMSQVLHDLRHLIDYLLANSGHAPAGPQARWSSEMLDRLKQPAESVLSLLTSMNHTLQNGAVSAMPNSVEHLQMQSAWVLAAHADAKFSLGRHKGVVMIANFDNGEIPPGFVPFYIDKATFLSDLERLMTFVHNGPLRTFCHSRLKFLDTKFDVHVLSNGDREKWERQNGKKRDFYNCAKVDTHIHAASSMTSKHLHRFIKKKLKTDEVIEEKDGEPITFKKFFTELGFDPEELTVDKLDVHADKHTKHRWDLFSERYNPAGHKPLRDLLLRFENSVGGRFFAEILKEVFGDLKQGKYQYAEPRISIHGRKAEEWDILAKWALDNEVVASPHVRLMVQIPRKYHVYKKEAGLPHFDAYLDNIFRPLFESTNDPSSHPELHAFLAHISGFDTSWR